VGLDTFFANEWGISAARVSVLPKLARSESTRWQVLGQFSILSSQGRRMGHLLFLLLQTTRTPNSDWNSLQGHDELNAIDVLALEPLIVGDEQIHARVGGAGQLDGVGSPERSF
jgi:hypothetical protein